jgi:hypothetical protein
LPINQPKTIANMAAADPYCMAVALRESPAAKVSFRWQPPSLSPTQNANSADCSRATAFHFGGKIAKYAANAVTTATFATF